MPESQRIALIGQSHLCEISPESFVPEKMLHTLFENRAPDAGTLLPYQRGRPYNTHTGALPGTMPEAAESY
jgi:hypothetical protein